ncbi:hypothetical protein P8452_52777 [Trifolium repens]|nr:hypothetical protein P8452_52777 [Trifolium repens]
MLLRLQGMVSAFSGVVLVVILVLFPLGLGALFRCYWLLCPQHNCVFFNEIPNDIGAFEWPVVTDIDIFILEV